ncbi:MAG TPA: Holliday junction resolvase RuvX [Alphaproteobacteria bacterium]|nr:Holliday junction resolvase RuvX [Alphaproteobacteria bacterium]
MLTRNPADLPAQGRIAAFDYGTRTVGVALSTSDQKSCASAAPLQPQGGFEGVLNAFKAAYGSAIVGAVVGLPLNMDGTVGKSADAARSFAGVVAKVLGVPVLLWDERLTSRQSEAAFFEQREGRQTRGSKKASGGKTDSGAAVLILQSALDTRATDRR